jgi:hypothetical protein
MHAAESTFPEGRVLGEARRKVKEAEEWRQEEPAVIGKGKGVQHEERGLQLREQ